MVTAIVGTVQASPGMSTNTFFGLLVQKANESGMGLIGVFNDIRVVVHPGDNPKEVETRWEQEYLKQFPASQPAPKSSNPVVRLSQLDWTNLADLIELLVSFVGREPNNTELFKVVSAFNKHGYAEKYCSQVNLETNDRHEYARFVIELYLGDLSVYGAPTKEHLAFFDEFNRRDELGEWKS